MASGGMNVKFNIMQQFGNSLRKKERKKKREASNQAPNNHYEFGK